MCLPASSDASRLPVITLRYPPFVPAYILLLIHAPALGCSLSLTLCNKEMLQVNVEALFSHFTFFERTQRKLEMIWTKIPPLD